MVGHAAPVGGPPHGGAWCVGVRCVVLPGFVLCVVVVRGPPHGGACCVGFWPHACWGVSWWCVAPLVVGLCCVVFCCVVWWCVAPLMVRRAALGCGVLCFSTLYVVVVCGPPHGGACRGGVWPPLWWGCVALCFVVWCGGVWPPSCRGVLRWCVAPLMVGRGAFGCGVLCCLALRCVWWWCVAPLIVGRAALMCGPPFGGACCVGVRCIVLCGVVLCVVVCGPPYGGARCVGFWPHSWWGVLWWCVAPPLVGRAVSLCSRFGVWCFSRFVARLVLLVRCCLRRLTAGVVGCWVSVVFAWPGRTGRPPERVWCATPLSWPGRTGQPPERVWCATPCFCFAGVVALLLVFPCSPSAFLCLRGSLPCFAVWRRLLLRPPSYPTPPLRLLSSAPALPRGVAAPAGSCCPPPPPPGFSFSGRWRLGPRFPLSSLSPLCLVVALRRLAFCWRLLLSPLSPGFVFGRCRRPAACLPLFSFCLLVRRWAVCPPPPRLCASGSSCCCLVPAGVGALCCLVLCFAVLCCCLLCCVVRGAVCRVVLCRVLLCFAGGVVLRCISSCGCALPRALPCSMALCCVVVHCGVR